MVLYERTGQGQSRGAASSDSISIVSALDVLGPVSKQRLAKHLKVAYGIDIWSVTPLNLDEIKHAIKDIFGDSAASLLMKLIYAEIGKVEE